ncbi:MAG TPA: DUF692 family protein [Planctomycetaceae bacterium]|jgi:uncharacterized protein (UPF0276 family)|nr:DUF692 family protein [Planctomycetaceae bacterium]
MIPAIGYTMCGAGRRRFQAATSLDAHLAQNCPTTPHHTAVEIDLDDLSRSLDSASEFEAEQVTLHAVSLPAGSADCRTEPALSRLTELARQTSARAVIARLDAMPTASAEGEPAARPRAWKAESADLCRQVEFVQTRLGEIPFYLESTVETEWFTRNSHGKRVLRKVLAGTGCGWFLDVTALYVEAMNSAQDACDFIEEMLPAADHVQLRLSGVSFDEKAERWVVSDAHPIPEAVLELYAFVLEVAFEKVDAVFVQPEPAAAGGFDSCSDIRTVREIAEGVSAIV